MADFSFKRDFKHVMWKETLWLNFIRSVGAGIVWFVLGLFMPETKIEQGLIVLVAFPVVYFIFLMPAGLISSFLSDHIPFVGWIAIFFAICIVVGDPLVYILKNIKKESVPVEKFNFFNWRIIIFVLDLERRGVEFA